MQQLSLLTDPIRITTMESTNIIIHLEEQFKLILPRPVLAVFGSWGCMLVGGFS
jgi:hypothetical protein